MPISVDENDIAEAVFLLQSIGVKNLCHQYDSTWEPLLPLCEDSTFSPTEDTQSPTPDAPSESYYGLRGQKFDSIVQLDEYYSTNILSSVLCVCGVALVSGLFLGLLTLDVGQLKKVQRASPDENERIYASALLPIIEERHLLLVTLLFLNTLLHATLPLFLDDLMPGWCAAGLATILIIFFGEILPSGIFTGPHQLYLSYKLIPLTRFFLWIMYIFAKPMAMILDYLLLDEKEENKEKRESYNRGELSALTKVQCEDSRGSWVAKSDKVSPIKHSPIAKRSSSKRCSVATDDESDDDQDSRYQDLPDAEQPPPPPLNQTEVNLIEGALQMKTAMVMDVYTPISHLYAVPDDLTLDKQGMNSIYRRGYSRVPVYQRNSSNPEDNTSIIGLLLVRHLMLIDCDHKRAVYTLPLQRPKCLSPAMNLVDGLRLLRTHGCLMGLVCVQPDMANEALRAGKPIPDEAGFMGVVTLEDIMNSLLQERIHNEWDIKGSDRAMATFALRRKVYTLGRTEQPLPVEACETSLTEDEEDECSPLLHSHNSEDDQYLYV